MNQLTRSESLKIREKQAGRPKIVTGKYLARLRELVSQSPRDLGYPFRRWTAQKLRIHLAHETDVDISARHINRLLKSMGLSTRTSAQMPYGQAKGIAITDLSPDTAPELDWDLDLAHNLSL